MTNEALLIIDYTNDFVDDKGALTCGKPAQELDDAITNLAKRRQVGNFPNRQALQRRSISS